MTYTFELSKPLAEYGRTIRDWAVSEIRPYAREADEQHQPPANAATILDSAPVPLGRLDIPGAPPVPDFEEGYWVTKLVMFENLAYGDIWVQPRLGGGLGHLVVAGMGTPEQRRKWYDPAVQGGGLTGAFALTEPHFGSDTSQVATTAVRDGDGWVLNGSKIYCTQGATSDYITVFATTDKSLGGRGITAFVVPQGTPGLHIVKRNESKLGIRSWVTSALAFEDCRVPLENRLGWDSAGEVEDPARASGQSGALGALSQNRPSMSAMVIGLAQASLDLTADLLAERRAGFTVQRWSVLETELARMNAVLDRARRTNLQAQWVADQGVHDRVLPAVSKGYGPPNSERVIRRCLQLLGPEGQSTELLLEKWYRDAKIMDIFEGSGQVQRVIVARSLVGRTAG